MKVVIIPSAEFNRHFKRLAKKYRSLAKDYLDFSKSLKENPFQGSDLGGGVRKIRMAIGSKGKGKSGGARVLTLNVLVSDDADEVTLLTIYDKDEISNVSDEYIEWLVSEVMK
ncbi:MAG: type II toxin-antitoxin system RelE/ParE family toxin [Prevotella sp.]|nr:type II toxin-antitoxin system RelE/ParE family toxin [Prevotella sp.]MBR0275671.1 type II toxin-antitoxin system RelE/ParE family toxin [Prevotella sp.]